MIVYLLCSFRPSLSPAMKKPLGSIKSFFLRVTETQWVDGRKSQNEEKTERARVMETKTRELM